jgi:uncharacterized protein involved in type VI secretion and phage assembly
MSLYDVMQNPSAAQGEGVKGVAVAIVTNNQDPQGEGRIKVKYPWRNTEDESHWARMITFMAGGGRGAFFLPEVNDEVLVAFENGDIDHPFILGALWSGNMKPPEANGNGKNDLRLIKSRSGHQIILDDTSGSEKIKIVDKTGNNLITIDAAGNSITIESAQDIAIKANNRISIEGNQLELKSKATTTVEAGATLDVKANANLTIKGAMVMIN